MLRLRDHPEGSTSTARAKVCVSLRSLRAIIKSCEEVGLAVRDKIVTSRPCRVLSEMARRNRGLAQKSYALSLVCGLYFR